DDLICTTLLATSAPVVICPAMNDKMYAHPQVQDNLDHLQNRLGYQIAGPATGALAVSEGVGRGRLIEPWQIEEAVGRGLAMDDAFMGKSVLVTAGPTQEPIDPVRYIGNHSSGRMGYAIAQAAWRRGANVTLVSGPSALDTPFGVDTVAVETAQDMQVAVAERIGDSDLNIFSAAVADFRPTDSRDVKLKRNESADRILIDLTENPDVARDTRANRKKGSVNVGFALETEHLVNNALAKLKSKDFDLVVANDANEEGAGFSVRTNRVTFVEQDAQSDRLPLMSKDEVAEEILDRARSLVIKSQ
ncbi:MAG: bifunctional phosphopantothenoylcysteine decarboxylase/phosphopantothenate--cysteine ligase CoaBC, partial [Myxococcales bacterium]|nr:bifunctional phosphopantothenoylcysteine decarboxylase/phosphopantothenate--cysteine ligase CoaBC [Myxococcales bacterium]